MKHRAEAPKRALTENEIEAFWRDGVVCVRQLYSQEWVKRLADALDDICSKPSPITGAPRIGTFHHDIYTWLVNDEIRDFVLSGPSAHIAQQAFRSQRVNFFYDQIFVKEQLTPAPTPWHHDFTFWPLEGDQIASLWTSVDAVDAESSALEFVAGSHRWPQRFRAIGYDGTDISTGANLEDAPDMSTDRDKYNVVSWAVEPGDALFFHALTLHGARGNRSKTSRRRAITTRWCGDDVVYRPGINMPIPYTPDLAPGDKLSGLFFPQILPEIDEAALAPRLQGPIIPSPEKIPEAMAFFMKADRVEVKPEF